MAGEEWSSGVTFRNKVVQIYAQFWEAEEELWQNELEEQSNETSPTIEWCLVSIILCGSQGKSKTYLAFLEI